MGYLKPFFHDDIDGGNTNVLTYCVETKKLTISLCLAYFDVNAMYVRGSRLPPLPGEDNTHTKKAYDIVTGEWVPRAGPGAVVFTEARVQAHLLAGRV